MSNGEEARFLYDPYLEWVKGEDVPVVEDFGVDLIAVETKPWARFGTDGAVVHIKGRGDFISIFIIDIPPGAKSAPQQHLFEEVVYVLAGHGSTTVETHDGRVHSFEWGPQSLFALPLNAKYQHFNASGPAPARLSSTTSLCVMLNLFHNDDFIFANDYRFPELYRDLGRQGVELLFQSFHNARREQADHDAYNIWQQIVPATMMCRAATNHFWISATNSMARCSSWPSFVVAPDGSLVDQLPEHTDAVLISRVDQDQEYWEASAPWRDRSVNGQLHSGTAVDHPRSTDRTCL